MKRSEINEVIEDMERLIAEHGFYVHDNTDNRFYECYFSSSTRIIFVDCAPGFSV